MSTTETDKYIEYVQTTMDQYKKFADELTKDEFQVTPQSLQYVLANFETVRLGILMEVQRRNREFRVAKRQFNSWWNSKLLEAKRKLTIDGKKYPAVKDYTVQATEDSKEEYDQKQDELQDLEDKFEFVKQLREDWNSWQYILTVLNDNMKSELRSLCIDRFDSPAKPTRVPKNN